MLYFIYIYIYFIPKLIGGCCFNIWFGMLYLSLFEVLFLVYIATGPEKKTLKQKEHQTFRQHSHRIIE